MQTVV